jgi:hypothetical protein
MNLSAIFQKRRPIPICRVRPARPSSRLPAAIEPLEDRIAPATLVNPNTVTFQDKNGDAVTVTISRPLFTTASVAKVFTFDTGSFGDNNVSLQQLELLNITKLGHAASGMDISITATPVNSSPGVVNVGYINASGIDLGNVTVGGDLGRIAAGDLTLSTQGIKSLTVESLGAQGLATQLAGGNLNTLITGPVGAITVNGDIDGASIGIGGGHSGLLTNLLVTGNINGASGEYSGSVRTQGGITNVTVDGGIFGGPGDDSGLIGTAGTLGTVVVDGSVTGSIGVFSGAILATKSIQSVEIDGGLTGGSGANSGQVGTAGTLGTVTIGTSIVGGTAPLSGTVLATGNITSVTVDDALVGGSTFGAGHIGSGGSIGTVTIVGSMEGGSLIHARQNIQSVTVNSPNSGYGIGINGGSIVADIGSIGAITAYGIDYAINGSTISAGTNIAAIVANSDSYTAISYSIFQAGGGINAITATGGFDLAIANSGFDAGGNIGPINSAGSITGSVFIAGADLGTAFSVVTGAGTFNNTSAASFGFAGAKSGPAAHIGAITLTNVGESSGASIQQSTFLAGVHGSGGDKTFGTKDDTVPTGSSIGAITSPGGLDTVWVESGSIGATVSGNIATTTYIATDPAVTAGGIGPITVTGTGMVTLLKPLITSGNASPGLAVANGQGIGNSNFISNSGIGNINVTLNGQRAAGPNGGIVNSTFQAGHGIGTITVVDGAYGSNGSNYGIYNSTFNAGLNGYGAVGDISSTLTDPGPDGNSAAIANVQIDASVCSCMSANMGSITAENADTASTAAGILDSTFRVHGNIGPISSTMDSGSPTAAAIQGTTFSAFGSIGDINVYGAVTGDEGGPSRFLAGYDIGTDMTFGNEDLSAHSLALQGGQSVGSVTVSGYFEGSDIIASVNPGAGYIFGDSVAGTSASNDSHVGAGGTIGLINIGANVSLDGNPFSFDHATMHGIEAKNFVSSDTPQVSAFGSTSDIPVVLYVDGGSNDVRITDLTQIT